MEDTARDDAAYLKSLRLTAGLDLAELAALSNLSAGQIRQLEDGGESLFYSPQIKTQSLRRVIHLLESPQPSGKPTKVQPLVSAPRTSANVIEDIIRLSENNFKGNVVSSPIRRPLKTTWMFATLVLVFAFGGAYVFWMTNRDIPQSVFSEWVDPMTHIKEVEHSTPAAQATQTQVMSPSLQTSTATSTTMVTSSAQAVSTVSNPPAALNPPPALANESPVSANANPAAAVSSANTSANQSKPPVATLPESPVSELKNKPQSIKPEQVTDKTASSDCTSIQGDPLPVKSGLASKAGNYVYFQSTKAVQVCIEDGLQHKTLLSLEPGASRSVHGNPPWTLASHDLKSLVIYYQGAKLWIPSEADKRIFLKEQPVSP